MARIHSLLLDPPILNSSSLWASSRLQLEELYMSDWTGAVTTRTATTLGFVEDTTVHKHALVHRDTSINSYGYSPHTLSQYLAWIRSILTSPNAKDSKPFIISIAPVSVHDLSEMLDSIQELRLVLNDTTESDSSKIGIEFNTSCPNIPGHPPPAYDPQSLAPLLAVFRARFELDPTLTIGLKLAPFVHAGQFQQVVDLLASTSTVARDGENANCVSFLSCTNTVGSSVLFQDQVIPAASSAQGALEYAVPTITGGLAGEPIHALSLGNVYSFRKLLSEHPDPALRRISIIGIGGVTSKEAVVRMRRVGASAVACATALGTHGVNVFEKLNEGLQ